MSENNTSGILMWEDNPDTPINANNLSEVLDFQSHGKFINFSDSIDNYENWAEHMINGDWPLLSVWDTANVYLNKVIYNLSDNQARIPRVNEATDIKYWETIPTPYNKFLEIRANTKISTSYTDLLGKTQTLNFDFGSESQVFTFDDLISEGVKDFEPETEYSLYLFVKYSYVDKASIKIVKTSDESLSYWKTGVSSALSPTGNDVISYRKIGGFTTNANKSINTDTLWDLYTYRDEVLTGRILIKDGTTIRPLSASDFKVIDKNGLYSADSELTVEEALFQTRALVNNLNGRFYTNKKFGFNLQFSHILKTSGSLSKVSTDTVTIRILPGFIDLLGTQVRLDEEIYLSNPSVGFKINGNTEKTYGVKLKAENDGTNTSLYAGVWTVYVDYNGQFTLRHELAENGNARWIPRYFGWFDTTGKRALGKFKVNRDNGNYIEKYSVTDVFEQSSPLNSIHTIYSTLCPDGLLPCDGKWHDIYGIDRNAYKFSELPATSSWGDSWYEETPNYTGRVIKGADPSFSNIVAGPYNSITNTGGVDDYTLTGGSDNHSHEFAHVHESGSLNILPSGVHPGDHQVDFNGSTEYVDVETVSSGIKVSTYDHRHNMTITGGDHSHSSDNFSGTTASLSDSNKNTNTTSSWAPFREALICIKKV